MKTASQILLFLLASTSSFFYAASKTSQQYRIEHSPVFHPKTGAQIPGYTRSEFHQTAGLSDSGVERPSAKIIVYKRDYGSTVSEEIIEYPHPEIGAILDDFHKAPAHTIKFPVQAMLEHMKTLKPESKEECRAKIGLFLVLHPAMPQATEKLITWEKQRETTQGLATHLETRAETDAKHLPAALKARVTTGNIQNRLNITYQGFGSIAFETPDQKRQAQRLGAEIISKMNPFIDAAISAEAQRQKQLKELK